MNIDFIIQFPAMPGDGYDCIMTIVDPLTMKEWWRAAREKDLTTEEFATQSIDTRGRYMEFLDDTSSHRDMRFISDVCRTLTAQLRNKHRRSTAYHLQTDSQAESLDEVVECQLKAYVAQC